MIRFLAGPKKGLIFLLLTCLPFVSVALNYVPEAVDSQWRAASDPLECRLSQAIPAFGEAVFVQRAGETGMFYLDSYHLPASDNPVRLVAQPPIWKAGSPSTVLAMVETSKTLTPVELQSPLSDRMLAHLQGGMFPVFSDWKWYLDEKPVDIGVSAVNFLPAYKDYQQCLAGLLDLDFEELSSSLVMFDTDKYDISPASRQRLKIVAQLVKADPSVTEVHIAGYTDDVGTRRYNMDLSRRRAEAVEFYLLELGVDASRIRTTFHGEANWASSARNEKGRALNRRVSVRLNRKD